MSTTQEMFYRDQKFSSYDELQKKIDDYSRKSYECLSIGLSRTLEAAVRQKKVSAARVVNSSLKFYEIKYSCVHGGKHKPKGTGKRSTHTFKMNCPFSLSLRLSSDGKHLVVTNVHLTHEGHDIGPENHKFYPKVRKLNNEERQYAEEMLSLGANNKKLQQQLVKQTGKSVLLRDLSNIASSSKKRRHDTQNDLGKCVEVLRQRYNCSVDISTDENEKFCGLFIQDEEMRQTFDAYPEIVFLDATYKLLNLQFPVYLFVCEDSNGLSEIVGMGMLVTEDAESLTWLIESFKNRNPAISRTRIVMADKDINERDTIKTVLPHIKVLICLFHTLRTFRREITTEKMHITTGQREVCLEYILKLAYAKTESEYTRLYDEFSNAAPRAVKDYFDSSWNVIKEEWVMGFKFSTGNFLNTTNNRLESINGKLKQVITKYSTLEFFFEQFFIILSVLRNERDYKTVYSCQKTKVIPHDINSPRGQYTNLLTSYASTFVLSQIDLAEKYDYEFVNMIGNPGVFYTESSEGRIEVSHFRCSCCFFQSMKLPCRHIFRLRQKSGVSIYDNNICAVRWTNTYYRSTHKSLKTFNQSNGNSFPTSSDQTETDTVVNISTQNTKKKLNSHEKFSKALNLWKKISNVISQSSQEQFERKLEQLAFLHDTWCEGKEVRIDVLGTFHENPSSPGCNTETEILPSECDVTPTIVSPPDKIVPIASDKVDFAVRITPILESNTESPNWANDDLLFDTDPSDVIVRVLDGTIDKKKGRGSRCRSY